MQITSTFCIRTKNHSRNDERAASSTRPYLAAQKSHDKPNCVVLCACVHSSQFTVDVQLLQNTNALPLHEYANMLSARKLSNILIYTTAAAAAAAAASSVRRHFTQNALNSVPICNVCPHVSPKSIITTTTNAPKNVAVCARRRDAAEVAAWLCTRIQHFSQAPSAVTQYAYDTIRDLGNRSERHGTKRQCNSIVNSRNGFVFDGRHQQTNNNTHERLQ